VHASISYNLPIFDWDLATHPKGKYQNMNYFKIGKKKQLTYRCKRLKYWFWYINLLSLSFCS